MGIRVRKFAINTFAVFGIALIAAMPATAETDVKWKTKPLKFKLEQGETQTAWIRAKCKADIEHAFVKVPKKLEAQVQVFPSSFDCVKGERVEFEVCVTGSDNGGPSDTVRGKLRIKGNDRPGRLSKLLPIRIKTVWPEFENPSLEGIGFSYPTLGLETTTEVIEAEDGNKAVEILAPDSEDPEQIITQASFQFFENDSNLSLDQFFDQSLVGGLTLRTTGVYEYQVYENGVTAYVLIEPIPEPFIEQGPIASVIAASPTNKQFIVANPSQISDWYSLTETIDDVQDLLVDTLKSLTGG